MNKIKKIYSRIVQVAFRVALPILPYRKPQILDSVDNIKNVAFWILGLGFGVMSITLISFMINCIQNITMGAASTIITNFIFTMPELIKDVILIAVGVFSLLILSMVLKNRPIEE